MTPDPTALALILCEQVIVDQQTNNPSPINIFTGRAVDKFPSEPQRFSVFGALTDSKGTARITLYPLGYGRPGLFAALPDRFPRPGDRCEYKHPPA
jgi:hypothetical protein